MSALPCGYRTPWRAQRLRPLNVARQALPADSPAQLYNEAPGVRTFPTEPPAMFFSARANGVVSPDPARLLASIQQAYSAGIAAIPEQLLAF